MRSDRREVFFFIFNEFTHKEILQPNHKHRQKNYFDVIKTKTINNNFFLQTKLKTDTDKWWINNANSFPSKIKLVEVCIFKQYTKGEGFRHPSSHNHRIVSHSLILSHYFSNILSILYLVWCTFIQPKLHIGHVYFFQFLNIHMVVYIST